jgi:ankyrin repeat protein
MNVDNLVKNEDEGVSMFKIAIRGG